MECSLMKQISKTDDDINISYARISKLERILVRETLPENKRKEIKAELEEAKKLLATNRELLSKLHGHNRKSFIFAAVVMLGFFTLYMFYVILWGSDLDYHL